MFVNIFFTYFVLVSDFIIDNTISVDIRRLFWMLLLLQVFVSLIVYRYLAICHLLRIRMTMRMARVILAGIWLVATTVTVPWAVFYNQGAFVQPHQIIPVCYQVFISLSQLANL